jgi:hypothetical protein
VNDATRNFIRTNAEPAPPVLAGVTIHSPHIRMRGVQAANVELRPWISGFPVCTALNPYRIIHVGFQKAAHRTRVVRTKQTMTYFLACIGGLGKVFIDGRWRTCGESGYPVG